VSYQILEYSTVLVNMYLVQLYIYEGVEDLKGSAQPETIFSQKLHIMCSKTNGVPGVAIMYFERPHYFICYFLLVLYHGVVKYKHSLSKQILYFGTDIAVSITLFLK
jgi:hypothetical protein